MRIVRIAKRTTGETRLIYVPNADEKSRLRSISGQLQKKAERLCPEGVAHGFIRFRSPVTNASAHVGHAFTTCFDLMDFFDSVRAHHLSGRLSREELALVLIDGAPRQGLPTSPAVANIAAAAMDQAILKWRQKANLQFVYTRYADDLCFSYDDRTVLDALLAEVPQIVTRCGFKLNDRKTRTLSSRSGRRVITGVAVDDAVHPTRRIKRRLRAAEHQRRTAHARGLADWCAMKPPREWADTKTYNRDDLHNLCKAWRLPQIQIERLPIKQQAEDLDGRCAVTPDPVYMLGLSNWTTGWTSCMRHPHGDYRLGVLYWMFLEGTRIAGYFSDRTMVVAGVERERMRARTLVHQLTNGATVYDRLYGNPGDKEHLERRLRARGYLSIMEARSAFGSGVAVVGHAPAKWQAYFDTLRSHTVEAANGSWKGKSVRIAHI